MLQSLVQISFKLRLKVCFKVRFKVRFKFRFKVLFERKPTLCLVAESFINWTSHARNYTVAKYLELKSLQDKDSLQTLFILLLKNHEICPLFIFSVNSMTNNIVAISQITWTASLLPSTLVEGTGNDSCPPPLVTVIEDKVLISSPYTPLLE